MSGTSTSLTSLQGWICPTVPVALMSHGMLRMSVRSETCSDLPLGRSGHSLEYQRSSPIFSIDSLQSFHTILGQRLELRNTSDSPPGQHRSSSRP